jgi:antitoxin ParD1/3/4
MHILCKNRKLYIGVLPVYYYDKPGGVIMSMRLVSVNLPDAYLDSLDELVNDGFYPNKSEAIRAAVRDMIKNELGGLRPRRRSEDAFRGRRR